MSTVTYAGARAGGGRRAVGSTFREHVLPAGRPRLAGVIGCDAIGYADMTRRQPIIGEAVRVAGVVRGHQVSRHSTSIRRAVSVANGPTCLLASSCHGKQTHTADATSFGAHSEACAIAWN